MNQSIEINFNKEIDPISCMLCNENEKVRDFGHAGLEIGKKEEGRGHSACKDWRLVRRKRPYSRSEIILHGLGQHCSYPCRGSA